MYIYVSYVGIRVVGISVSCVDTHVMCICVPYLVIRMVGVNTSDVYFRILC